MFNLFGNEGKAKRLEKDALTIIRSDEVAYPPAHLKSCALMVVEYLAAVCSDAPKTKAGHGSAIWLKEQHRDARRRRDQIQLTAATLSIISLRACELGRLGAPICEIIDNAMERWADSPDAPPRPLPGFDPNPDADPDADQPSFSPRPQ